MATSAKLELCNGGASRYASVARQKVAIVCPQTPERFDDGTHQNQNKKRPDSCRLWLAQEKTTRSPSHPDGVGSN